VANETATSIEYDWSKVPQRYIDDLMDETLLRNYLSVAWADDWLSINDAVYDD
jgi:hypothetical protein